MFLDNLPVDLLGHVLGFLTTDEKRVVPICSRASRAIWVEHSKNEIRRIVLEELAISQPICLECHSQTYVTVSYYRLLETEKQIRQIRRLLEDLKQHPVQSHFAARIHTTIHLLADKLKGDLRTLEARIRENILFLFQHNH